MFLPGLEWSAPGCIACVWNLATLSGAPVFAMPAEEPAWAIAFGLYWSGVYEHFTWRRPAVRRHSRTH